MRRRSSDRSSDWIRNQTETAGALRSKKVPDFHGHQQEFILLQKGMIEAYEKSRTISHPRDLGREREEILRRFLIDYHFIPNKFGISDVSCRVVSPSGHISPELDILFYNHSDGIILKRFPKVLDYHPVESVYGVIQVKSRATKATIKEGLENIAAFKRLQRPNALETGTFGGTWTIIQGFPGGFGVLFFYESSMDWVAIVEEVKNFINTNPNTVWPNAVFVLNQGYMRIGDAKGGYITNLDLMKVETPIIYGFPDRESMCLYHFYGITLHLLMTGVTAAPKIENYFRLPLVAGDLSYRFVLGPFAETARCLKHGEYLRVFGDAELLKVVEWCRSCTPIQAKDAMEKVYGPMGGRWTEGEVRIYNPQDLPLNLLLVTDQNGLSVLAYDTIEVDGLNIWLPLYYTATEKLIAECPECVKAAKRVARRKSAKAPRQDPPSPEAS